MDCLHGRLVCRIVRAVRCLDARPPQHRVLSDDPTRLGIPPRWHRPVVYRNGARLAASRDYGARPRRRGGDRNCGRRIGACNSLSVVCRDASGVRRDVDHNRRPSRPAQRRRSRAGTAPFAAIGLVSYSWYLWHWPLLSFLASPIRGLTISLWSLARWRWRSCSPA
jgi:hypothetical protein